MFALQTFKVSAQNSWYPNGDPGNISIYHNYFKVVKEEYIDICGPKNYYKITFENTSTITLNIEVAVKKNNGKWEVGTISNIKPGASTNFGACYPSSEEKFIWWAQPYDKANKLPTPREIDQMYQ